eukprot:CAMPEP_0178399560 /NCGR_PEP_ID=MMETSP0689_2-20121128/15342_1 /TAXON_ID=160604 /ORGANISM="Amphidinium massartii, Strain CS-259" /LENGTH=198 /DNA_ID=CAMNT_0020020339 /DNA_START=86 /DNA_END=683 /DNA_ORIENTATION=+
MAAASSVEEKPCPEVMGVALDTVACAVPAQTKMEEPKHQAFGDSMRGAANALTLPACAPKPGDQVYTKILCCACGIGEVLGQGSSERTTLASAWFSHVTVAQVVVMAACSWLATADASSQTTCAAASARPSASSAVSCPLATDRTQLYRASRNVGESAPRRAADRKSVTTTPHLPQMTQLVIVIVHSSDKADCTADCG